MAGKRTRFSVKKFHALLIPFVTAATLLATFIIGVMVGREMKGIPMRDDGIKSPVVKMKIESQPIEPPAPGASTHDEKTAAVMNNNTSKPVITFYDTLAKPHTKEAPVAKAVADRKKETREKTYRKVFTVQVGAMKDKGLAEEVVSKLKRKGYSASISTSETPGKTTWYRVQMGTFSNKEEARKEAAKIERIEGMSTTVVLK